MALVLVGIAGEEGDVGGGEGESLKTMVEKGRLSVVGTSEVGYEVGMRMYYLGLGGPFLFFRFENHKSKTQPSILFVCLIVPSFVQ